MKYRVSRKGSKVVFEFETYEQAADFCYTYVMASHIKGDKFPELSITSLE